MSVMKSSNKKGQQNMAMPFGMIFSIILIIVFFVTAFIAIGYFLDIGKSTGVGMFYKDLQEAVNNAWAGQSSESTFKIDLPSGIEKICFANLSAQITGSQEDYKQIKNYQVYEANTFLVPPEKAEKMEWKLIQHIDVARITAKQNPYCVPASGNLKIQKGFYDKLVCLGNDCQDNSGLPQGNTQITIKSKCQRAEDDNLCDGLSILRSDYKEACCTEHGLCC